MVFNIDSMKLGRLCGLRLQGVMYCYLDRSISVYIFPLVKWDPAPAWRMGMIINILFNGLMPDRD